jgi:peroxiredoxin
MKKIFFAVALLIIGLSSFKKDEGKTVPSIKLKDLTGKPVDLKDMVGNGKVTVLSFWATWCSPCKKEIENMTDYLDDWKKNYDVQLVAISIDDARNSMKVKPYVEGKKWDFPVLLDENQETQRALDFVNVPYTIVIDKHGNIAYKHSGYTEGDELILQQKLAEISKQ